MRSDRLDLVIRGGTLVDGTGAPARTADVAVAGGRIVAVEQLAPAAVAGAREVIDADGALVTPGFVDIHTHYDGQATWSPTLDPSSWHGVTTVVMGNCGVGFAPVRPSDRATLISLMEGVEDIPGAVLHEGVTFDWSSFPSYLDAVAQVAHDVDVAALVPHGAVRLYVMGDRGARREAASAADIEAMGALVAAGMRAGALGFSTSRTLNHRTAAGDPTPTLTAAEDELVGVAALGLGLGGGAGRGAGSRGGSLGARGAGYVEVISDFDDIDTEFRQLRRIAQVAGRPVMISLNQRDGDSGRWRTVLDRIAGAAADGLPLWAQVAVRPIGLILGLQATINPFMGHPMWGSLAPLGLDERVALMRSPDFRASFFAALPGDADPFAARFSRRFDRMFRIADPPDYEPPASASIAAEAARLGVAPEEVLYEALLERDGRELLFFPIFNYFSGDCSVTEELLRHPRTVIGLSDGGAHVGTICDASFPTTLLTHWCRDRTRGPRLGLEWAVQQQTSATAWSVGLHDRGVVAPGYRADLNVVDFDELSVGRPEMRYDLPAGGKRLVQHSAGYLATIVAGEVTYRSGVPTGALPGRLVRGEQPAPAALQ